MKFTLGLLFCCLVFSCQTPPVEFYETEVGLDEYRLEKGFELQVIAAEPLLKAPVAMDFDAQGRIWVAQMPGYMNDMQGSDEEKPVGSIQILEDLDGDGVADHTKTFLDSLVMPRALAHVYGGLLYAAPPNLWFVEIENDEPTNRVLVDSIYAVEGNPEHQPNGLLLNIDNWIYNAKSNFRYQRKNGVWKKEPTTFRGQWGISSDNFGRLYYNDNSRQLLGDHVLPNRLVRNTYFTPKVGVDQLLTKDQRVYPLHATTVNRGYAKGVLNKDSILLKTTAACSPLVYRGGVFPESYAQNVFVCIPEGNLIKRNILTFTGDSTIAEQAWEGKEFLASTDEGFRPVNLNNGPDGSLYIVDMHRGMIGHHAYLSPYLKEKTKGNRLDTLTDFGRILKVRKIDGAQKPLPDFDALQGIELVGLLAHKNGWVRNRAQHYLVFKEMKHVLEEVQYVAQDTENEWAQIHALRILEAWDELTFELLSEVAEKSKPQAIAHAIVLMESFASTENAKNAERLFIKLLEREEAAIDLYLGSTLGKWMAVDNDRFFEPLMMVVNKHKQNRIVIEAVLSGLDGEEDTFLKSLNTLTSFNESEFGDRLSRIIENRKSGNVNQIFSRKSLAEDNRTAGAKMFYQICASCHGANGQGIDGLAPPLMNSEYVADAKRLALIVLHGLEGPVHVNGELYDMNLAMPGLIRNEDISDKDIADIISYVTNAFSNRPAALKPERIKELREVKSVSGMEYTEEELNGFVK
ncbi:c-type cytochrome [Aggregatimonas sangjinii]|uniref:C-type cytochrome n=1 Tax=Aggregatimonas sangjinii TaxID=2583587 RepID=A0A5B7SX71_9FLAO|nr:c-type cytochrome [Aggregatimonas sangjinii]QCX01324.1 c-type cytochrome [Aggregatimonas sangjinii]